MINLLYSVIINYHLKLHFKRDHSPIILASSSSFLLNMFSSDYSDISSPYFIFIILSLLTGSSQSYSRLKVRILAPSVPTYIIWVSSMQQAHITDYFLSFIFYVYTNRYLHNFLQWIVPEQNLSVGGLSHQMTRFLDHGNLGDRRLMGEEHT